VLFKRLLIVLIISIFVSSSALGSDGLRTTTSNLAIGININLKMGYRGADDLKIVKILDDEGKVTFEILDDEIIRLMKKDLSDRYKAAKQRWNKDRKAWKAKFPDQSFVLPKPISPKVTVVKKGYDSRSEAEVFLDEFRSGGPFCIYQVEKGKEKTVGIVTCDEFPGVKYAMEKAYHDSVFAWLEKKNGFEKENSDQEFEDPQPSKVKVRILKNRIKTMDKAESLATKYT